MNGFLGIMPTEKITTTFHIFDFLTRVNEVTKNTEPTELFADQLFMEVKEYWARNNDCLEATRILHERMINDVPEPWDAKREVKKEPYDLELPGLGTLRKVVTMLGYEFVPGEHLKITYVQDWRSIHVPAPATT